MSDIDFSARKIHRNTQSIKIYVLILFFLLGGVTSLNSILIPKLKDVFSLGYLQAMLIEIVFFTCYLLISIPAGLLIQRCGYVYSICVGLLVMLLGCCIFIVTTKITTFAVFLLAICVLATGVVVIQVVANPLISLLGSPDTAASRLTFAQAFNSLGTTIFLYIGAIFILEGLSNIDVSSMSESMLIAYRSHEANLISQVYLTIAVILFLITLLFWTKRHCLLFLEKKSSPRFLTTLDLLKKPRFLFGTLCIPLYVGAEVAIGSVMVNYLMRSDTLHLMGVPAGQYTSIYWGSAMVGRFIGYKLLTRYASEKILSAFATIALSLVVISSYSTGFISGWSLIFVGLFNSIMFPTIFSLANFGLKDRMPEGSGIICTSISGSVIISLIFGYIADFANLRIALLIPAACYAVIVAYGIFCLYDRTKFEKG
ncbi:sugar MFS transporter [Candidatus Liberibacter sp.]|uniref:sugar MFS transporter n=1 Tax=Candidatus Liberibacter sp. TaxID=34022 RepID=UPI0015F58C6F|nr:sugar MFS transporter [Candidatus Liberibacter sp.]MBA5724189.1 sugar MFS transporter [Candidatus Liberibacter sp.]